MSQNKVQISEQDARNTFVVALDSCLENGKTIEEGLNLVAHYFGSTRSDVRRIILARILGLAINENLRAGMEIEAGIKKALHRFDVDASPAQILALVSTHHQERERINTRLEHHEMDDGAGGTLLIENEHGEPINKKDLAKKQ